MLSSRERRTDMFVGRCRRQRLAEAIQQGYRRLHAPLSRPMPQHPAREERIARTRQGIVCKAPFQSLLKPATV